MKWKTIWLLFIFAGVLGGFSDVHAQFLWQVEHTDHDGRYYYAFDAISCSGNSCTASGSVIDTIEQTVTNMFWRSDDDGTTWTMQNPGLPSFAHKDLSNKHFFSVIRQIDSLNVIAGGNLGYLVRTFDGGKTWQKQDSTKTGIIKDIHFFDSLNGIVLNQGISEIMIQTTSDGGKNWKTKSLNEFNPNVAGGLSSCYSYGSGKFRVFKSNLGPIYTTFDNWQTTDSTKPLFDVDKDPKYRYYYFYNCNFSGGDTIIVYGAYYRDSANTGGILMRSTDAGITWEMPVVLPRSIGFITSMTSLDRDTVLAGCESDNNILMSTDRGISWRIDSLKFDIKYEASSCNGIDWTAYGHPIAIYANLSQFYGTPSIIARGEMMKSGVLQIDLPLFKPHVYPNPASNFINLISLDPFRPIHIIDIFGREVLRSVTTDQGTGAIDISSLSHGIYDVLLDRNGRLLNAGKIAVIGR